MKVLMTKDRESAGGGIISFINAIHKFFTMEVRYSTVGRPFAAYGETNPLMRITSLRLIADYLKLLFKCLFMWPDIVHINTSLDTSRAINRDAVNILLAKMLGRKVLVFWHGWFWKGHPIFPYKGGNDGLMAKIYRSADAYVVLSERFREDLLRWGFKKHIYVSTTSFDEGLLKKHGKSVRSLDKDKILFLSSVLRQKGVVEVVEAYRILREKGLACELTIAGDGDHMGIVKELVRQKKIPDVSFLGYVKGEEKRKAFESSTIFCFPSYDEAFPVVVLEAMAMGLPIVSSDVGGLKEIMVDGETGFVVHKTPGRKDKLEFAPEDIAGKLERLIKDQDLKIEISRYNTDYAREVFHPRNVAGAIEGIYSDVVRGDNDAAKE